jgi:uncharacterized membrane protein
MAVPVMAISAGVSAVTGIVTAISGTSDAEKRRLYEQNIGLLTLDQQKILNKQLLAANSETARQQILGNTLGSIGTARVNALSTVQVEKEKTKKVVTIAIIAVVLVVVGLVVILKKR